MLWSFINLCSHVSLWKRFTVLFTAHLASQKLFTGNIYFLIKGSVKMYEMNDFTRIECFSIYREQNHYACFRRILFIKTFEGSTYRNISFFLPNLPLIIPDFSRLNNTNELRIVELLVLTVNGIFVNGRLSNGERIIQF